MKNVMVTGAAGFVGSNLVKALLDRGCNVTALVRKTGLDLEHPNLCFVQGDMQDQASLMQACEGVDTVFHTAACIAMLGGKAATAKYRDWAYGINVKGAENIVAACKAKGVARLVQTSSVEVCFNSEEDLLVDEHAPYATTFNCLYTETKIQAEKTILAANEPGKLLTCALRPDGIWGVGQSVMMESIFASFVKGMPARLGGQGAVHDHVHVDNLVHAHLLAADALEAGTPIAGKAYFITDGEPAALFDFIRPFVEGLGYKVPGPSIPGKPLYWSMKAWEWMHFKFGISAPVMAPHEVNKAIISHVINSDAAKRDFGYTPIKTVAQGMTEAVEYYRKRQTAA